MPFHNARNATVQALLDALDLGHLQGITDLQLRFEACSLAVMHADVHITEPQLQRLVETLRRYEIHAVPIPDQPPQPDPGEQRLQAILDDLDFRLDILLSRFHTDASAIAREQREAWVDMKIRTRCAMEELRFRLQPRSLHRPEHISFGCSFEPIK